MYRGVGRKSNPGQVGYQKWFVATRKGWVEVERSTSISGVAHLLLLC